MRWIILLMLVLGVGSAYADTPIYKPSEVFELNVHLTNSSGDVIGANCSIQLRNESLDVLLDDVMTERTGGWYNYTYNNSKVGDYYCRQNCTQGPQYTAGTCDFKIGVENDMLLAIIVLIPLIIGGFMLVIGWMIPKEHWGLKIMMPLLALTFVWEAYNYGVVILAEYFNFTELIELLADNTYKFTIIWWVFAFVVIIGAFWYGLKDLMGKKHKTGDYGEYDEK